MCVTRVQMRFGALYWLFERRVTRNDASTVPETPEDFSRKPTPPRGGTALRIRGNFGFPCALARRYDLSPDEIAFSRARTDNPIYLIRAFTRAKEDFGRPGKRSVRPRGRRTSYLQCTPRIYRL